MGEIAIKAEGLSKLYRLGQRERYRALRDSLANLVAAPFRWSRESKFTSRNAKGEYIWALNEVSFEIKQGEVVGIIGHNGAGKSTLLKILSRVTEPRSGYAEVRGRIGSLLEVGTGFHPELTGRENIYFNGAILGMKRAEIQRKFDEIVAFAEIEKFIDTPVKYYSSGMYMRLAFAVAAHLECEILLVDEVLAVGDASFQRKCLGKMEEVGLQGRTVLFVSHNLRAVQKLCPRAVLLEGGKLLVDGPSSITMNRYIHESGIQPSRDWPLSREAPGDEIVRLLGVRAVSQEGRISSTFDVQEPIRLQMDYAVLADHDYPLAPNFRIFDQLENCIFITWDHPDGRSRDRERAIGKYTSTCVIPANLMNEGTYYLTAVISTRERLRPHFYERRVISFRVTDAMQPGGARGDVYLDGIPGAVRPLLSWYTERL